MGLPGHVEFSLDEFVALAVLGQELEIGGSQLFGDGHGQLPQLLAAVSILGQNSRGAIGHNETAF
jgi:hypothetical protein